MDKTAEELAYAAGFFDGEGCINIAKWRMQYRDTKEPRTYYKMRIMVVNTDLDVLKWYQGLWGGSIQEREAKGNRRRQWNWNLGDSGARIFLEEIAPHLKQKRRQAELALEFKRTDQRFGRNPRPSEYMEQRERFYQQMRGMKLSA